jgi:hypothetical protein
MNEGDQPPVVAPTTPTHGDVVHVWEGHPDEDYRRDMSHWRGHGRWPDEKWQRIGEQTRACVGRMAAMLGRPIPRGSLLEWGPGGGANLAAFTGLSSRMYGVDVSAKNLEESARVIAGTATEFTPILLEGDPRSVASEVDAPIELFVSTAVFQHFPTTQYGRDVLSTVAGLLAPGAMCCVQIRYDDGTPKYRPKEADYFARHVTFTSYALDEFWDMIAEVGLEPLCITDVNSAVNYAAFCFVDPRSP